MKSLNMYLGSVIDNDDLRFESLLDDDYDFYDPKNDKKEIENWIRSNYKVTGKLTILKDYTVNCTGNAFVTNESITSLTNGLFRWGKVNRDFVCSYCKNLTSLEGAPGEIGGSFSCKHCKKLESLEGAPEKVDWDFNCICCDNLESLEGAPGKVENDFVCNSCSNLKSLEGAPKKVGGEFWCNFCDNLTSLKGAPEWIGKKIYCYNCKKLKITDSDREKYKIAY